MAPKTSEQVLNGYVTVTPDPDDPTSVPVTYADGTPRSQIEHADLITNPSAWRDATDEEVAEDHVYVEMKRTADDLGLVEGTDYPQGANKEQLAAAIRDARFLADHPETAQVRAEAEAKRAAAQAEAQAEAESKRPRRGSKAARDEE